MKIILFVAFALILSSTSASHHKLRRSNNNVESRELGPKKKDICCNCLPAGRFRGICTSLYAQDCDEYIQAPNEMDEECRRRYDAYRANFDGCDPGYVPEEEGCRPAAEEEEEYDEEYICDCLQTLHCLRTLPSCEDLLPNCNWEDWDDFAECWPQVGEMNIPVNDLNFRVICKRLRMSGECGVFNLFHYAALVLGVDCNNKEP